MLPFCDEWKRIIISGEAVEPSSILILLGGDFGLLLLLLVPLLCCRGRSLRRWPRDNDIELLGGNHPEPRGLLRPSVFDEFGEERVRICQQGGGRVELHELTLFENHDAVRVDDRMETVGNREHRALPETLSDRLLDEVVGLQIDRSSRLQRNRISTQASVKRKGEKDEPHQGRGSSNCEGERARCKGADVDRH